MIQNKLEMFSEQQAVTATADSTNVIYIGDHGNDIHRFLDLFVQVTTAAVTADGAATVTFALYGGTTENTQATLLWTSAAIGKAALTLGAFPVKIALPKVDTAKYLKLIYTVATGPLTAGTFDAGIIWGVDEP
jgi:hypothetical protein